MIGGPVGLAGVAGGPGWPSVAAAAVGDRLGRSGGLAARPGDWPAIGGCGCVAAGRGLAASCRLGRLRCGSAAGPAVHGLAAVVLWN